MLGHDTTRTTDVLIEILELDSHHLSDMATQRPPFDREDAIYTLPEKDGTNTKLPLHLPAIYVADGRGHEQNDILYVDPVKRPSSLRQYFERHLSVKRLDEMRKYLWLAGLVRPAQPLHRHLLRKRNIMITERADYHLLWHGRDLLIMPLPTYLLDYDMWTTHICPNPHLSKLATGMLSTYIWLVCSETDLRIAHQTGLLKEDIDWPRWTAFVRSTQRGSMLCADGNIHERYRYGELRLARINWIHRFTGQPISLTSILRGYSHPYTSYRDFLGHNTAWLVSAAVYIQVMLTAIQVSLATDLLKDNRTFNLAAYGFSVFAVVGFTGILTVVTICVIILVVFNSTYTMKLRRKTALVLLQNDLSGEVSG